MGGFPLAPVPVPSGVFPAGLGVSPGFGDSAKSSVGFGEGTPPPVGFFSQKTIPLPAERGRGAANQPGEAKIGTGIPTPGPLAALAFSGCDPGPGCSPPAPSPRQRLRAGPPASMSALDAGPWAQLQVSGAVPEKGICPSGLLRCLAHLPPPRPSSPAAPLPPSWLSGRRRQCPHSPRPGDVGSPAPSSPAAGAASGQPGFPSTLWGFFRAFVKAPMGLGGQGGLVGGGMAFMPSWINFVQVSLGHEGCGARGFAFTAPLPAAGQGRKERMGGGGSSPFSSLFLHERGAITFNSSRVSRCPAISAVWLGLG